MKPESFVPLHDIWMPEAVRNKTAIPPLVVLGGGIDEFGILSEPSRRRADLASVLLAEGKTNTAILSGGHPAGTGIEYRTTEAEGMLDRISVRLSQTELSEETILDVTLEEKSTNTFQNFFNLAGILEEKQIEAISVIAGFAQMPRSLEIGRRVLGSRVELLPVPTENSAPKLELAKEWTLRQIIASQGRKTIPGDFHTQRFVAERYDRIVSLPKALVRGLFMNY